MEHIINEGDLYVALSDLFAADNINYDNIASTAKLYPVDRVEYVLFHYVAPVCYYNTVTAFCLSFDEDDLLNKIDDIKKNEENLIGRIKMNLFSKYMKFRFNHEWQTLKNLL